MSTELITKRAEILQGIITRMAQNSFTIKGWAVTIIAALLAFANKDTERHFALLAIYPSVVFWGLDAYYVMKERHFRALPMQPSTSGEELDFTLPGRAWWRFLWDYAYALLAPTVALLYVVSLFVTWLVVCT
ncbi:hypothetical protein [Myxococcus landrumensis]|uniref:Lipoprotein n=1 Tax=Myxococcus landrumensis TaxID=2813577 RepID=A0ABX7NGH2_9BACT|nr:hypothetical protein [Myxococcus landrumus]QSQ17925.1 hypothetical protein JY572_18650 [Myxococcus landrumus]